MCRYLKTIEIVIIYYPHIFYDKTDCECTIGCTSRATFGIPAERSNITIYLTIEIYVSGIVSGIGIQMLQMFLELLQLKQFQKPSEQNRIYCNIKLSSGDFKCRSTCPADSTYR